MTRAQDEALRLRLQADARDDAASRAARPRTPGAVAVAAATKAVATYPTAANAFYACATLTILGAEVEGGAGTITTGADTFYAYNSGSAVPPVGTKVIATFASHRWVFRYDG